MSKSKKGALMPALRFPEFRNSAYWQEQVLGDVIEFQTGFPFNSENFTEEKKGIRLVRNRDLKSDDKPVFYVGSFDNRFIVYDGDVLVGMDGDFSPVIWSKGRALLNQRVGRILAGEKSNLVFMHYFLTLHLKDIEETTARTTVKHLSHSSVEKLNEALPSLQEQKKIADCLFSIDELITAESQKLETLKTHKKGLMQQLFPAEGETVPKRRFPEFRDAGEWDVDTLVQAAKFRRGSFPQPYGLPEWYDDDNGMPFVQVFDVSDDLRLKQKTKNKISKLGAEQSVFIAKNTLIVTLQGSIGRVAITQYDAYIDRTLLIFEEFLRPIEKLFFAYVIQSLFEIEKEKAPGGIIKTITKEALSDFEVKLPSLAEQHKIADCFSSVDELISATKQKLDVLNTHKKGLMQQLFPVMDEVEA